MCTHKFIKSQKLYFAGALYVLIFRLKLSVSVLAIICLEKILWIWRMFAHFFILRYLVYKNNWTLYIHCFETLTFIYTHFCIYTWYIWLHFTGKCGEIFILYYLLIRHREQLKTLSNQGGWGCRNMWNYWWKWVVHTNFVWHEWMRLVEGTKRRL
jgi:hypothetical protein